MGAKVGRLEAHATILLYRYYRVVLLDLNEATSPQKLLLGFAVGFVHKNVFRGSHESVRSCLDAIKLHRCF